MAKNINIAQSGVSAKSAVKFTEEKFEILRIDQPSLIDSSRELFIGADINVDRFAAEILTAHRRANVPCKNVPKRIGKKFKIINGSDTVIECHGLFV
ncbi:MAG: hypothetical protein WC484_03865 [Candidatus Omnitrophota bacterium]